MADSNRFEPFPTTANLPSRFVAPEAHAKNNNTSAQPGGSRSRGNSAGSRISNRIRRLSQEFEESNPPEGFFAATADFASSVVAAGARSGPHAPDAGVREHGGAVAGRAHADSDARNRTPETLVPGDGAESESEREISPHSAQQRADEKRNRAGKASLDKSRVVTAGYPVEGTDAHLYKPFDNGYHFPPKYSSGESFKHFMIASWRYVTTPLGFVVTLYGLNVVAWGGMIFLLLCNAAPAMCYPSCNDINSPRRKWIEYDSQILNALFCVTGFGLAPWRLRDMYYLLKFRMFGDRVALRRLAGIHRGWIRLEGSQNLPIDVGPDNLPDDVPRDVIPYPESKLSDPPLTGYRAEPTRMWKVDFILWMNVANTFLQCVLSGFMWGMNRYVRPSWSTGLFVALACIAGAVGGLGMFLEGKRVKSVEGVPLSPQDEEKLLRDREQGIYHYNNLKAKRPKEKEGDPEANLEKGRGSARGVFDRRRNT